MEERIYNENCLEGMNRIEDCSVDAVITDPPYLYLTNQKLDKPFDEALFFNQVKRILKKDGFIVIFGRGTSFYRWCTRLSDLGFTFKEEIIWDKRYSSSPMLPISRIHETIAIFTKGKGKIIKAKVPYLEAKRYDLKGIIGDIKRMRSIFNNPKSLKNVQEFLENNKDTGTCLDVKPMVLKHAVCLQSKNVKTIDRCVSVINGFENGMREKSIIRTDKEDCNKNNTYGINRGRYHYEGDRCVAVVCGMEAGMKEKSIIKEVAPRYKSIHPTQKPVRLIERLMNLVSVDGDLIVDPFSGSGSTFRACQNTNRRCIAFELDKEFYDLSIEENKKNIQEPKLKF